MISSVSCSSHMLDIKEPCEPKSLDKIKALMEKKRKYDEDKKSFMAEDEPLEKKRRRQNKK